MVWRSCGIKSVFVSICVFVSSRLTVWCHAECCASASELWQESDFPWWLLSLVWNCSLGPFVQALNVCSSTSAALISGAAEPWSAEAVPKDLSRSPSSLSRLSSAVRAQHQFVWWVLVKWFCRELQRTQTPPRGPKQRRPCSQIIFSSRGWPD